MAAFEEKEYKIFEMFRKDWALVTAGTMDHFNSCTVSWGSLGTLWTRPGSDGSVATVYIHPGRYTQEFMAANDTFTISFFPAEYKKALGYMGSRSGRDGDKAAATGLTPVAIQGSVTYEEASLTMLCKKVYQHQFAREDITPDMQAWYRDHPKVYPVDENGDWQAHWVYVGDIIEVQEK